MLSSCWRKRPKSAAVQDRNIASPPGVVDLLARRRGSQQPELRDDVDDVFTRYYATHSDA